MRVGRPALDLSKPGTIERAVRERAPDIVVSAAAYTAVDRAEDEPDVAMRINGEAAGILAQTVRASGARLIHISTDYVYGGSKNGPYVETDPVDPQNAYGRSKLEGERRVLTELPQAVILRTSWVYSPFGRNFVKTMLELARTGDRLAVVDDQRGNPTSALDLADAIISMVVTWKSRLNDGLGEIYHCAGSGDATWRDFAEHVFAVSRMNGGPFAEIAGIATSQWPAKAKRASNSRLDCSKFTRDFAWSAPHWRGSVELTVRRLLAAHKTGTVHDVGRQST
jgi:dTDP-4-dehydrorhamnose reductase